MTDHKHDHHKHEHEDIRDGHKHEHEGHKHEHEHEHEGHKHEHQGGLGHVHTAISNLKLALVVNLTFSAIEVAGGFWSGSVAVLSSAIHDLSDALALLIAIIMEYAGNKTSNNKYTYGYRRLSLLSALLTCALLVTAAAFVIARAIPLLVHPEAPNLAGMTGFAVLGVIVNGFAALRLSRGGTMNEQVASWHMVEDVLGWASVLVGSIVMRFVNLPIIDPVLSIMVALFILWGVLRNLQRTLRLFLQATPEGLDVKVLRLEIEAVPRVVSTHDAHLWSLDGESHVFTVHVVVAQDETSQSLQTMKQAIRTLVASKGKIHLTIEIEEAGVDCPAVNCVADI